MTVNNNNISSTSQSFVETMQTQQIMYNVAMNKLNNSTGMWQQLPQLTTTSIPTYSAYDFDASMFSDILSDMFPKQVVFTEEKIDEDEDKVIFSFNINPKYIEFLDRKFVKSLIADENDVMIIDDGTWKWELPYTGRANISYIVDEIGQAKTTAWMPLHEAQISKMHYDSQLAAIVWGSNVLNNSNGQTNSSIQDSK